MESYININNFNISNNSNIYAYKPLIKKNDSQKLLYAFFNYFTIFNLKRKNKVLYPKFKFSIN